MVMIIRDARWEARWWSSTNSTERCREAAIWKRWCCGFLRNHPPTLCASPVHRCRYRNLYSAIFILFPSLLQFCYRLSTTHTSPPLRQSCRRQCRGWWVLFPAIRYRGIWAQLWGWGRRWRYLQICSIGAVVSLIPNWPLRNWLGRRDLDKDLFTVWT